MVKNILVLYFNCQILSCCHPHNNLREVTRGLCGNLTTDFIKGMQTYYISKNHLSLYDRSDGKHLNREYTIYYKIMFLKLKIGNPGNGTQYTGHTESDYPTSRVGYGPFQVMGSKIANLAQKYLP